MKRVRWMLVGVLAVTLSGLGWFGIAQAQSITATVDKGKTVDGSVYSGGQTIRIHGTVNGDVHCAGQDVIIDGTVKGDVLCAAQTIKITGTVEGSVRVAGQDVLLNGAVGGSISVAGDRVMVAKDARVARDATLAASTLDLQGVVARDATLVSAKATISGTVNRHVAYSGGDLSLTEKARVNGGITYRSDRSITVGDKAVVNGAVERKKQEDKKNNDGQWLLTLVGVLAALAFAVTLVLVWPQAIHNTSDVAVRSLGKTLLVGFAAAFAVPGALILLAMTLIGIPLAIFGFLAWLLILMLSGPVAGYYLGSMILSKAKNPIIIMLFGVSLLLVLYAIPVVSFLAMLFAYLIGSGALLLKIKRRIPKPRYTVE